MRAETVVQCRCSGFEGNEKLLIVVFKVQFSSGQSLSRVRLCDPMNRSTPGLPVYHQLLEFTQTHVHWVGDAIQPSHPLSSPSPPAPNLSQHQGLFKWVSSVHQVAKVLGFQPPGKSSFYFAVGFGIVGWWCLLFCVFFLLLLSFTAKHFALYGHTFISITVLSHPQACPTLCDPMDSSLPGSSVHGILQARILEWVAMPSSRGIFLTQGSNPGLLHCRQILYYLSHQESLILTS